MSLECAAMIVFDGHVMGPCPREATHEARPYFDDWDGVWYGLCDVHAKDLEHEADVEVRERG